jgi:ribosomal-protein-alanine N-acetyltransferase
MLVGKRVIVRTLRQADLDRLYDVAADVRDMGDYWPMVLPSEIRWKKRLGETGWWEEDHGGVLITDHQDNIVGQIVFFKPAPYMSAYELGYRIYKPEHWGKGYMSEAVSLMVAYLFETRPVDRIQATFIPGNEGSHQVLEKCGFQFEGILRKAVFQAGASRDLHLYAIVRGEHRPLKELLA